ncbi:MAG: hypothetical protein LBJ35_02925 [Spirochaetaceae bacterium]|jgi:hypothetical protein|nr:hypothetical protein [Spirochaetaceae bacterium]
MKNKPPLVIFFFLFNLQFAASLDFTVQGGVDYSSYPQDDKNYMNTTFTPEFLPIAQAALKGDFAGMYNYNVSFGNDPIWRNMAGGDIGYYFGNVDIGLGFFTGVSDFTFEYIDVGFSGRAGVEFPGVFLVNAGFASSLNKGTGIAGSASRQAFNAQAGFWLPNIFIITNFQMKNYIEQTETSTVDTSSVRYSGSMELFSKNTPYRIRFSFGWQTLSRVVDESGVLGEANYNAFLAGFRFYSQSSSTFAWFIEGEALSDINNAKTIAVFYNASIGLIFSYPER